MNKMDFKCLMERNSFKVHGEIAYGSLKGYPVLIKKQFGGKVAMYFYLEGEPWGKIREKILQCEKKYKANTYFENGHIVWKTRMVAEDDLLLQDTLEDIILILQQEGIKTPKNCVICGKEDSDAYAVIQQGNQPVHKDCLQEQMNQARDNLQKGSYILGVIGGILGGIIGCLPCLISLLTVGRVFCVLFLIIPPGIYFGCKFFNGKMNYFVLWLSVLLSLVSVYVMEIVVRIQYVLERENLSATIHNCWILVGKLVHVEGIWWSMTKDAGLNFIFALIGILINWELISRTSVKVETNILEVINTVNYNATLGEKNALSKAKSYLKTMAFSKEGLIDQLLFEGFTEDQATYGVNNCGANWNEQACKKAKSYLRSMAFSKQGLLEQLLYEKFTDEQAAYGVDNCGADWNEQAYEKAKDYLNSMSFSRQALIDQLIFEGFTESQAIYGVDKVGLD